MYVCMYVCMCMYVYAYLKNKSHVLNLPCILVARVASNVPKVRYHHTGQWLPNTWLQDGWWQCWKTTHNFWHVCLTSILPSAGAVVIAFQNTCEDRDSGRPNSFWTHARTAIPSSSFPSPSKIKHLGAETMMCTSRCWENDIGNGWHEYAVCSPITCAQTRHFLDRVLSISSLPRHGKTSISVVAWMWSVVVTTATLLILIFVGTWAIWEFQPCTANVVPVSLSLVGEGCCCWGD